MANLEIYLLAMAQKLESILLMALRQSTHFKLTPGKIEYVLEEI
jgi:hypothetical protein